jgi:hypothetical protein
METENLLSIEQQKSHELEKKLERLRLDNSSSYDNKIEKKGFLNIDAAIARALEVEYSDLTIDDIISQGNWSF